MGRRGSLGLFLGGGLVLFAAVWQGCSSEQFVTAGTGGSGGAGGSGATGGGGGSGCVDADQDGYTDCELDCDDGDPLSNPGAPEICGDTADNDCDGQADPEATCGGMGTYVSALAGSDSNPGTKLLPLLTIDAGITNGKALGQPVFVAQGDYPEDITLEEGVSLLGGYACASAASCTWQRDPAAYVSTILGQDVDGLYAGHQITRATVVEGFTVTALPVNGGQNVGSAMFIQGAPEIRGNVVEGAVVTGCAAPCGSRAIVVSGPPNDPLGVLITRNTITGGDSSASSQGITVENSGVADIVANDIRGGAGTWTRAVAINGSAGAVAVRQNDIHAGSCVGNSTTFALYVGQGASPVIDGNHINTDPSKVGSCLGFSGSWWTGGIESEGSVALITNNIVRGVASSRSTAVLVADCEGACQLGQVVVDANTLDGGGSTNVGASALSAAVAFKTSKPNQNVVVGRVRNNILLGGSGTNTFAAFEDVTAVGTSVHPQVFANNDLFDAAILYFQWTGTGPVQLTSIANVNAQVAGASANISADPLLDGAQHLAAGSPCVDTGSAMAGETPTTDIDGDDRPLGAGIDIGADEAF